MSGLNAVVSLRIKNPNTVRFCIYSSNFDVYYNGIPLGRAKTKNKVQIDPSCEKEYSFRIMGSFKNIGLQEVMRIIGNAGNAQLQIQGNMKAGKFFFRKKFPVDVKESVGL